MNSNIKVVIDRDKRATFIEWPESVSIATVNARIQSLESEGVITFDLLDPDVWEYPEDGGFRVHAMFREDLESMSA